MTRASGAETVVMSKGRMIEVELGETVVDYVPPTASSMAREISHTAYC